MITEHYSPRIGGITTYVKDFCSYLSKNGHDVTVLVPGENSVNSIIEKFYNNFILKKIGTGLSLSGNIKPKTRRYFCEQVNSFIDKNVDGFDVVHILFGIYSMRYLKISDFKHKDTIFGVTIHNIPPHECGLSWSNDKIFFQIKDLLRKKIISLLNNYRINYQKFNFYIVPSLTVKKHLASKFNFDNVYVINHGTKLNLSERKLISDNLNILTVGGFIPHKNQHLIPKISKILKERGINFKWNIVGPNKHDRYVDFIRKSIIKFKLEDRVFLNFSVSDKKLKSLYESSNIYVQPSSEEGFCFTVLEAALNNTPIIGTDTGAIEEIINSTHGLIVNLNVNEIAKKIILFHSNLLEKEIDNKEIISKFNWDKSVENYISIIDDIRNA